MAEPRVSNSLEGMRGASGLITDLIHFPRSPLDFRFHVVTVRVDDSYESSLAESIARCVASGISDDPELAAKAAIGEAWERIAFVDSLNQIRGSRVSLPADTLTAEQVFRLPFLLDRSVDREEWARQVSSVETKTRHYRAYHKTSDSQDVELPVAILNPLGRSSLFETTNGLACADSFEVALDRAVREVVERDALMLIWLTKCGGRHVAADRYLPSSDCAQIERMSSMGIRTVLRDISTGLGIRVFLAGIKAEFPGNRIGLAFGAGAHRSAAHAAKHAFREACLSWRGVAWRSITGDSPALSAPPDSFAGHAEYYSSWDRMHFLDFLFKDEPQDAEAAATEDERIRDSGHLNILLDQGLPVYATDITPLQASDTGLTVVQAIVPSLVPLYIGDRQADDLAWQRLPTTIGGIAQDTPVALETKVHPWP
ncbi:MAG: YcaO-like family protein [Verrucomicrobiota bacterium]